MQLLMYYISRNCHPKSISTIQVTAANQTPSPTMVTETVNTPCVSVTNLSVDTVQVQNNDAEQSTGIADNAINTIGSWG